jgi:hypothetical protein
MEVTVQTPVRFVNQRQNLEFCANLLEQKR